MNRVHWAPPGHDFPMKRVPSRDRLFDCRRLGSEVPALRTVTFQLRALAEGARIFELGNFFDVEAEIQGEHQVSPQSSDLYLFGKFLGQKVRGDFNLDPHFLACVNVRKHTGKLRTYENGYSAFMAHTLGFK